MKPNRFFSVYAWFVWVFNLLVVGLGAYVRATGSGAGCGTHWPLCNGEFFPSSPSLATMIEFSHRVSSGLILLLVLLLFVFSRLGYKKESLVRKAAGYVLVFTLMEVLIGAGLVLFELVADNASLTRALSMVAHLINTYLLIASLTLTAWWASRGDVDRLTWPGGRGVMMIVAMVGFLLLGASGGLTALGDTLFPSSSLAEGLQQDFSPAAHFLIRLRVLHPFIAALVGLYILIAAALLRFSGSRPIVTNMSSILIGLFALQLVLGGLNIILLVPVWLQVTHLIVSDLVWTALVLTTEVIFSRWDGFERLADYGVKVGVE